MAVAKKNNGLTKDEVSLLGMYRSYKDVNEKIMKLEKDNKPLRDKLDKLYDERGQARSAIEDMLYENNDNGVEGNW